MLAPIPSVAVATGSKPGDGFFFLIIYPASLLPKLL
jgi:hypothetical protein